MGSLFTLNYLILAFNFETFVANLVSKYKQAKRDCRTARCWSTRHCNKQDLAKTEASSSMSLPSNILFYETDSKFHERLAAHRLLSPDKIHINFANYVKQVDRRSGIFIMTNTPLSTFWLDRFASCENIVSRSQASLLSPPWTNLTSNHATQTLQSSEGKWNTLTITHHPST